MRIRKKTLFTILFGWLGIGIVIVLALAFKQSYFKKPGPVNKSLNYTTSLNRGIIFEKNRINNIPSYERLILDYLQRKYSIDNIFSASKTPIPYPSKEQGIDPAQFGALRRIAYPSDLVVTIPDAAGDSMSQMLMEAINCDHISLNLNFRNLVEQNLKAGKYQLTHVAFALQRLQENDCHPFSDEDTQNLRQRVINGMSQILADNSASQDLKFEAVAFLLDLSVRDKVPENFMSQMITDQLSSGGWSAVAGNATPDDHTTTLALWALLAYVHPDAPNEPMIRH